MSDSGLTANGASSEWTAWATAAGDPALDAELRRLYDRLAGEIAAKSPTCWLSGKCCHFDSYGHRLYVTGLEIAWLVGQLDPAQRKSLDAADLPALDGCPFQVSKMCGVHALRPLGCRVYYCDPTAQDWQSTVYEGYLDDLRLLHDQRGLPYRYMEWRVGLAEAREVIGT